jgi:hypothetical protein
MVKSQIFSCSPASRDCTGIPGDDACFSAFLVDSRLGKPSINSHIGEMQVGIVSWDGAGMDDLSHLRLINSPAGSTGRMIIEGLLSGKHLRPDQIMGNCNEVKTEDAVVSAVINGSVDAGISSAARAAESGLSFASLTRESHVLVIRKESLGDERILSLLHMVQSTEFRLSLGARYTTTRTGQVSDFPFGQALESVSSDEGIPDPGKGETTGL